MFKYIKTRNVQTPSRANDTDSGLDFFVPNDLQEVKITGYETQKLHSVSGDQWIILLPWEGALIPSGIKLCIETWYDLVFENKSGIATKQSLIVGAKVVDSSYRGEVHLHMINVGKEITVIKLWQKIAQWIIREVKLFTPLEITEDEFSELSNTDRWVGWFGSSGI